MRKRFAKSIKSAGKRRVLNARKDRPDLRDRMYEPALIQLARSIDNRNLSFIRDQGEDGACTGFGLAAVIDVLNLKNHNKKFKASTRMLYEMGKRHDEWPGADYEGSSCRGALRGWKNMGVCSESDWRYDATVPGELTIERAYQARTNTLGAYFRLRPELNDYHTALNEAGALYVSATVHEGWEEPKPFKKGASLAVIKPSTKDPGGHAFAIVGYTSEGFIVQNSWGNKWGSRGFALWLYEDWLANIDDGWVFRMALPVPKLFGLTARSTAGKAQEREIPAPKRLEIAGHYVHFDDGKCAPRGDYWSTLDDVKQTADLLKASNKYQHLFIYAHGGLNSPKDCARRVAALKNGFMRNGIYPFHVMYDTGLGEEIKDAVLNAFKSKRAQGFFGDLKDKLVEFNDALIEDVLRKPVTPLWDEMKRDALLPFVTNKSDGSKAIETMVKELAGATYQVHLAGHSTGAVLIGHLLNALDQLQRSDLISTCSLMAPACSIDFYQQHYEPRLANTNNQIVKLPALDIYNLSEGLELTDNVAAVYRKSLLYLVSRALERLGNKPILGMEKYSKQLQKHKALNIYYSDGKSAATASTSHGGFDNDLNTMNGILERVLGHKPKLPFTAKEMEGF